jgi:hypothetical protein
MLLHYLKTQNDEAVKRFTIAAAELLREEMAPRFANDAESLVFLAGPPLTGDEALKWAAGAKDTRMDIAYFAFEPGRERFGPTNTAVIGERSGIVYRWTECSIWAPKDAGPFLVMPTGLNLCFSHDGKALISHTSRPTKSVGNGIARARKRLTQAAQAVTGEQLATMEDGWKQAA